MFRTKWSLFLMILTLSFFLLGACGGTSENPPVTPTIPPTSSILATENVLTVNLSEVSGGVLARKAQETSFSQAGNGYVLQLLGQVQTKADGRARLDFSTGTLVRLAPNTLFTLQPPEEDSGGLLMRARLELGRLWVILQGGSLEVETKSGVAAVRGSYMSVSYDPASGEAKITCLEGHCSLTTPGGFAVEITAGQTAVVTGTGEPPKVGDMDDQDVQDWLNANPEAAVVIPGLTETPSGSETPVPAADASSTPVPPLPSPPVANSPVPSRKPATPGKSESTNTPVPSTVTPVPASLTPGTGTVLPPSLTPTSTTPTVTPTLLATFTRTVTSTVTGTKTVTSTATVTPTITVTPVLLNSVVSIANLSASVLVVGEPIIAFISVSPATSSPLVPAGTVWITGGATVLCTANLDSTGSATCNFTISTASSFNLEAHYSGDGNFNASNSSPYVITVSQANTTTTISAWGPNPSSTGDPVTFTALVDVISPGTGMPLGSVTFSASTGESCTISAAPWTCSITFTHSCSIDVTASYSGDANFSPSLSASVSQLVNPCP